MDSSIATPLTPEDENRLTQPPGVDPDTDLTDEQRSLLHPLALLSRDIKKTAGLIGKTDAGFLVNMYYRAQRDRIRLGNQLSSLRKEGKSTDVIEHFYTQAVQTETQVKAILGTWVKQFPEGKWAQDVLGIGPVLSAAFSAYIDLSHCPTLGHLHSFAGMLPPAQQPWNKGEKRPWNAQLRTVCWKVGTSFVKVSNRDDAYYGKLYRQRKAYEIRNNQSGSLSLAAAETLTQRNIEDPPTKACYEGNSATCAHKNTVLADYGTPAGDIGNFPHMPPGRIDNRARRWTTKMYMAHWWTVAYRAEFGTVEPYPYPIAYLGHVDYLEVPDLPEEYRFPRSAPDGSRANGFWDSKR